MNSTGTISFSFYTCSLTELEADVNVLRSGLREIEKVNVTYQAN